jgi:hypothetical protein
MSPSTEMSALIAMSGRKASELALPVGFGSASGLLESGTYARPLDARNGGNAI